MDVCLHELRRSTHLDASELTLENAMFKSFDMYIKRQLDAEWHKLGITTKQLIQDLKTLRRLLDLLLRYVRRATIRC